MRGLEVARQFLAQSIGLEQSRGAFKEQVEQFEFFVGQIFMIASEDPHRALQAGVLLGPEGSFQLAHPGLAQLVERRAIGFGGEPERLQGRLVSAEFFSTLGIQPLVGRDFLAEDDRPDATPAAILSYSFWQRRFGADPGIIGKQLTLNKQSFTVIGITSPDFQFGAEADVTVPIGLSAKPSGCAAQIREPTSSRV